MTSLTRRLFRRAQTTLLSRRFRPSIQHLERRDTPAPFTPGNLVIYRVGEGGSTLLSNAGSAVFLDEYTRFGTLVQSIPMPTNSPITNLVSSGTATTEGLLTLSPDGKFLALAGYNSSLPGTVSLPGTSTMTVTRSVAVVDSTGTSTITAFTNAFSGGNPRGATTSDGSRVWLTGSNVGLVTGLVGAATATVSTVSTTNTNLRGTAIYGGQLYDTSGAGTAFRIGQVGTGLPTTAGTVTTSIPGLPGNAGVYNGFSFFDLDPSIPGVDTLYAAEETEGFKKFSFDGAIWTPRGNVTVPSNSLRGLTAHQSGNCVLLYGTNASGSLSTLFSLTDMSGSSTGTLTGSAVAIATAGANTAFRGGAFTPSATTPAETLMIDTPAITVTNSVSYNVTFNSVMTGLTASNFALTTTGDVIGTIGTPTTVDGIHWNVPVTGIVGDGSLRLDLVNSTGVSPTLFFLPFACGKTVTVDNSTPVATLSVVNGIATYYGTPGFNNNVTVTYSPGFFSITDAENITLGVGTGGFTGGGTQMVTANGVTLNSIRIKLGGGADTLTVNNMSIPLFATGGGDSVDDTAFFQGNVNVTGKVTVTGFDSIDQLNGAPLRATSFEFSAQSIGNFLQPIVSQAQTVSALGGDGGVYWQELDGSDFTVQTTGPGEMNLTNMAGTLRIAGASKFGSGAVNLSSGDDIAVDAPLGDGTSSGTITVQANTDGVGKQGYSQNATGQLNTSASGPAIMINVNSFGGNGDAVLGMGNASGINAVVTVNVSDGNILWSPQLPIPMLNANNPNTLASFNFSLNATGNASVGSAAAPLQLSATQGGITTANSGTGGIYITDWAAGESSFAATAVGPGSVQIWTGNGTNNGIIVAAPGITTGTGTISLRADDNLFLDNPIGGPGFAGPVFLEANLDGSNSQGLVMNKATSGITTSDASAMAVVINTYSQADTFSGGSVGGVVLTKITTGNGGGVVINTNGLLNNSTDAKRSGVIRAFSSDNLIDTGSGMVILTAKNNGIGSDTINPTTNSLQLNITASKITAVANSIDMSDAGVSQFDGSIFIHATTGTSISATTTTNVKVGRIEISAEGALRLHGDLKTDDGSIMLTTPSFILQDGGVISTTGTLNLNYNGVALLTSDNSVGTLVLPPQRDLVVNGSLTAANPITIAGGKLSGTGKISAVIITNDGSVEGNLAPGNSPGILGSGNITWSGGSRFSAELSGPNAGTGYDQLIVTGTVDIGNATLDVTDPTLLYAPAPGKKHFLILNDGSDTITGNFKGFPEGATYFVNGLPYTVSYMGNGDGGLVGNDMVLTAPGVAMNPPTVSGSVAINGGNQRSMVQSLVINFSEPVTLMPGAFKVEGTALGPIGTVGIVVNNVGSSVTITFDSSGVPIDPLNSLKDGKYKLTMNAALISSPNGTLDGNGNMVSEGSPTDDVVFEFHRLFGDGNGDGSVTASDFNDFRTFYGNPAPGLKYDFDGGGVSASDFNQFRTRYGLSGYLP